MDYAGIRSTVQSDLTVVKRDLKLNYGLDYDWEDHQWAEFYKPSNNGLVYTATGETQGSGPDTDKILGHFYKVTML